VALSLLLRLPREGRPYNLHILTDSEYSIGCIEGGFSTKVNKLLVRSIRKLMKKLVDDEILGALKFVWVPGHADLEGNERADLLANFGADGSAAGRVCDMVLAMDQAFFIPD
jgi:ribonuclease HI